MIDLLKTPFWARRATILIAVLIGFVTLIPAQQLPNAPGSDKLHHVIAFAALVIPMCYAKPHQFWKYALYGAAFGAFIEIVQPLVNRSGEASDFLADVIGIALGVSIGLALRKASSNSY